MGLKIGRVKIIGRKEPIKMIIDTGSDYNTLRYEDARTLGMKLYPNKNCNLRAMGGNIPANGPYALTVRYKNGTADIFIYFYNGERILGHEFFQKTGVDINYNREKKISSSNGRGRYFIRYDGLYDAIPTNRWSYRPTVIDGRWWVVRKRKILGRIKVVRVHIIRDVNWIRELDRKYG